MRLSPSPSKPVPGAVGRFTQHIEAALDVGGHHPVEGIVGHLCERRDVHSAGVVDDDIEAAEGLLMRIEQGAHRCRIGNVRLAIDGAPPAGFDLAHDLGGELAVGEIVDGDGEPVPRQALGRRGADSSRRTGDQGCPPGAGAGLGRR